LRQKRDLPHKSPHNRLFEAKPGHRPVFFYSRSENKLYRLENYIGYIVAQDFILEAPHIIKTEKQKIPGEMEGVPIKVNLSQILRRKGRDGEPKRAVGQERG
jgi:hypothetical protein